MCAYRIIYLPSWLCIASLHLPDPASLSSALFFTPGPGSFLQYANRTSLQASTIYFKSFLVTVCSNLCNNWKNLWWFKCPAGHHNMVNIIFLSSYSMPAFCKCLHTSSSRNSLARHAFFYFPLNKSSKCQKETYPRSQS